MPGNPQSSTFGALNPNLADGVYTDITAYNGIAIQELRGRSGTTDRSSGSAERVFLVAGDADPAVCRDALVDGPLALDDYDDLYWTEFSYERMGPQSWEFTLSYTIYPKIGEYRISIDTTGGTIEQRQATNERVYPAFYGSPLEAEDAPYFRGAIDVQKEGDDRVPKGIQRIVPSLKLQVQARIAKEHISSPIAYAKRISELTGTVNSVAMFDSQFEPFTLLFTGASGDITGENPLLTFNFEAGANIVTTDIGPVKNVTKFAHEYLWYHFETTIDDETAPTDEGSTGGNSNRPVTKVVSAHVNSIYAAEDWSDLFIGVAPP